LIGGGFELFNLRADVDVTACGKCADSAICSQCPLGVDQPKLLFGLLALGYFESISQLTACSQQAAICGR